MSVATHTKWIVDVQPFEQWKGKLLTGMERDRVEQDWKRIQELYTAELEAIKKDSKRLEAYRVAETLRTKHDFFKKVKLVMALDLPFAYYIQWPQKDDPTYKEKIVARFAPHLQELRRIFESDYTVPLGLRRQQAPELYRMAILASPGDYKNNLGIAMQLGEGALRFTAAHYNQVWRTAITYEDALCDSDPARERRHAILHEFVHAPQHAHAPAAMPKPMWYVEGLAEYLAAGCRRMPGSWRSGSLRSSRQETSWACWPRGTALHQWRQGDSDRREPCRCRPPCCWTIEEQGLPGPGAVFGHGDPRVLRAVGLAGALPPPGGRRQISGWVPPVHEGGAVRRERHGSLQHGPPGRGVQARIAASVESPAQPRLGGLRAEEGQLKRNDGVRAVDPAVILGGRGWP